MKRLIFKRAAAALAVACLMTMNAVNVFAADNSSINTDDATVEPTISETVPVWQIDKTRSVTLNMSATDAEYTPIAGVEYTIYLVSTELDVVPKIEDVDVSKLGEGISLPPTDEEGKSSVTLSPEQQGIYLVRCTAIPETVAEPAGDFLITLPYSYDGSQWQYELDASPKVVLLPPTEPESATVITTTPTEEPKKTYGDITGGTKGTAKTGDLALPIYAASAVAAVGAGIVMIKARKTKNNK